MDPISGVGSRAKKLINHIDTFEEFCTGKRPYSPSTFRRINEELSIGAVLLIGKHRYKRAHDGKHLMWKGIDNREHDLGTVNDANVMRDYPGFHASRSLALGKDLVKETQIVPSPNGKGNLSIVTMVDGTMGIAPNYRMALRNASLRMHLKSKMSFLSIFNLFGLPMGYA